MQLLQKIRDQIANVHWIIKKAKKNPEKLCFFFFDYAKAFDCVDHNKLWKIFQELGIPDHLTSLVRNVYAGQEATVKTRHGKKTGSKSGRSVQGCILSPCLFSF